jgi:hypothetical protein
MTSASIPSFATRVEAAQRASVHSQNESRGNSEVRGVDRELSHFFAAGLVCESGSSEELSGSILLHHKNIQPLNLHIRFSRVKLK